MNPNPVTQPVTRVQQAVTKREDTLKTLCSYNVA